MNVPLPRGLNGKDWWKLLELAIFKEKIKSNRSVLRNFCSVKYLQLFIFDQYSIIFIPLAEKPQYHPIPINKSYLNYQSFPKRKWIPWEINSVGYGLYVRYMCIKTNALCKCCQIHLMANWIQVRKDFWRG